MGISKRGGARGKQERHPFTRKQWYKIQSPPNVHNSVQVGWTPVNKTVGTKLSKDGLMNRVCEVSFGDIQEQTSLPGKKSECKSKKLRDQLVTLPSTVSISSEKNYTTT